jgi:hypothetical protein
MALVETGLRVGPTEKKAKHLAHADQRDIFSGPVLKGKSRNCGHFLRFPGEFWQFSLQCRLAEREEFEPSVQLGKD